MKKRGCALVIGLLLSGISVAAAEFSSLDKDGDGNVSRTEAQSEKQLSNQFTRYDVDKDKVLSKLEYETYSQQAQMRQGAISGFSALDKDGDGNVSPSEAGVEQRLSSRFGQYDVDKDKVISEQEYQAYQQQEQLRKGMGSPGEGKGQGQQGKGGGQSGGKQQNQGASGQ